MTTKAQVPERITPQQPNDLRQIHEGPPRVHQGYPTQESARLRIVLDVDDNSII